MAFARTVTHTKTLISPSTGSADLVYGADYVSATSHTAAVSGATSGGIPYFDSATSEACSALLAANGVVIGGGAGTAPYTDTGIVTTGTGASLVLGVNSVASVGGGALSLKTNVTNLTLSVGGNVTGGSSFYCADGSYFGSAGRSLFTSPSNGNMTLTSNDGTTIATLKAKYASSDGSAGVASFGPAAVASITVKDGIITAIS